MAYAVIGISTDDDRAQALQWLRRSKATVSHYIDHDQMLERWLGAQRIPVTILIDSRGRVVAKVYGSQQWDSEAMIQFVRRSYAAAQGGRRSTADR